MTAPPPDGTTSGSTPAPPTGAPSALPDRRTVLTAAVPGAIALVAIGAASFPRPASLQQPQGDEKFAAALAPHLAGHRRAAAVLRDATGATRFAGFGALEDDEFEIGSATKTFTGALLALAVEAGEVTLETTVEQILGERAADSAIADVTLAELASHTSGLPRLASTGLLSTSAASFLRHDPYQGRDAEQVIDDALGSSLSGRGQRAYSNLGVALQGQLLAMAAGTDYASLLGSRLLEPLGLSDTYAPIVPEALRNGHPTGHGSNGLGHAAWTMDGSAPAGGIRSTPRDLMTYLAATLDGSAPGAAAAHEVLHEDGEQGSAMNWIHDIGEDTPRIIWHNGMTGGFASFLGFVPETGEGVVLLTDTARSLDDLGFGILTGEVTA